MLIRAYHDAAATFPWAGREWAFEPRRPLETVCHNELFPWNTVFRSGVPVAFIDWDTAAPGLLLNVYGLEPDIGIVHAGMERMREGLAHLAVTGASC